MKTGADRPKKKVLVVEDDPSIRYGLVEVLESEGFLAADCDRGDAALAAVRAERPDLIILDVMLPAKSGFEICKELRESGDTTPILMLTAKGQEYDKVIGLDSGADDYVTKPFGLRELVARIHALLRRAEVRAGGPGGGDAGHPRSFQIGDVIVHPAAFQVERRGKREPLTPKELGVLELLHARRGEVLSRDELLDKVWGLNYFGTTRTVDQTVAQLRKKIGDGGGEPRFLLTVHGAGYKLRREGDAS
jgi:DNA-binding response OmpR family regulator